MTCLPLSYEFKAEFVTLVSLKVPSGSKLYLVKRQPLFVSPLQSTPVNATVFRGLRATDADSNVNGQVEFRIARVEVDDGNDSNEVDSSSSSSSSSAVDHFAIDLPHQGLVRLNRRLDYETNRRFRVTIVASVREGGGGSGEGAWGEKGRGR